MSDKIAFEPYLDRLVKIMYDDGGEVRTMKGVLKEVTNSFIVLKTLNACLTYRHDQILRVKLIKDRA